MAGDDYRKWVAGHRPTDAPGGPWVSDLLRNFAVAHYITVGYPHYCPVNSLLKGRKASLVDGKVEPDLLTGKIACQEVGSLMCQGILSHDP
jgi:hypothetical protein